MTELNTTKDWWRAVLARLIEDSNTLFTVEDVLHEFRAPGNRSKARLLKILQKISHGQPKANDYLLDASLSLEKNDPYYCLLTFLEHYKDPIGKANENLIENSCDNIGEKIAESCSRTLSDNPRDRLGAKSRARISEKSREKPPEKPEMKKKDYSTSTPLLAKIPIETVTPDNMTEIKERVQQAAILSLNRPSKRNSGVQSSLFKPLTKYEPVEHWDYTHADHYPFQKSSIAAVPLMSQESIVIKDLLYCLSGIRTASITPERSASGSPYDKYFVKYKLSPDVHPSLRDVVEEILPTAEHYIMIQNFANDASFSSCGQVLQAIASSMTEYIADYFLLLSQLETELESKGLSIHKMLYYLRPTMVILDVLAAVVRHIVTNEKKGGEVLTLLYNKINHLTGEEDAQKFLIKLTIEAAQPYMKILHIWVEKGLINDPYNEFMVEDNERIKREELPHNYSADYWEKRYTIRRERVPIFLDKVSDIILRTGKYLNVIRQCGKKITLQPTQRIEFSPQNQSHLEGIHKAYAYASKNLLVVLLKDNDLMGHLLSVKRYLLMYQGDFIMQFMDACEDELVKSVDNILPTKLDSLLGLTLRLSSANHDLYKDDVHCELLTYDLVTQMSKIINKEAGVQNGEHWHDGRLDLTGMECLAFRRDVKWPISLVLNHLSITKYQMLFRQLFYLKHVERQLSKIWKENAIAKKFEPEAALQYRFAFTLRHRMLDAIQNILYYMMIEVIEPNWHIFNENMKRVENVDEVLVYHQDFLDTCLKNCMLSDTTKLNRAIFKMCNICLCFVNFIMKSSVLYSDAEITSMVSDDNMEEHSESEVPSQKQSESSLAPTETFDQSTRRFDLQFNSCLLGLLVEINEMSRDNPSLVFINLSNRINFNGYYNEELEKRALMLRAQKSMLTAENSSVAELK